MIVNFKSSKAIIAGLYRDLGNNTELNESDIIEWISEALSMIGSYPQMKEVSTILTVANHTVSLPCDFVYPKDITYQGRPLSWSTKSAANNYKCDDCNTIPTCCTDYNFYISDGCSLKALVIFCEGLCTDKGNQLIDLSILPWSSARKTSDVLPMS